MSETTAIIGAGNLGGAVARLLAAGGESVVVASRDDEHAKALADELGPNGRPASVEDAVSAADNIVIALRPDASRELIPRLAPLLDGKVVVDPSNPVGFDAAGQIVRTLPIDESASSIVASLLPAGAHYVKAFSTVTAVALADSANHEPRFALFYATDDEVAAGTAERLIRTAGFEPLKAGGSADGGRLEAFGGDLNFQGQIVDLEQARAALAGEPAQK